MIVFALLSSLAFATEPPKFGWKKLGSETFSLDATGHKDYRLPKGRLLLQFKADEAIYAGVATEEQYAPFRAGKYLELIHFNQFHCVKKDLIEGGIPCNIGIANTVVAIRDKRGPLTRLSVVPAIKAGASGMADKATKSNKVIFTLFRWDCLENCPRPNP